MFNDQTQIIGLVAGILTSTSLLPQLFKIIKSKKADDISLFYLGILLAGLSMWIWYGIQRDDIPIIATNSFSICVNLLIIFFGLRYKHSDAGESARKH